MDFSKEINRWGMFSSKWSNSYARDANNINPLVFTVADMDYMTPQCVLDALKKPIEHGVLGYNDVDDSYIKSCVGWLKKRHNWLVDDKWILPCGSIKTAMLILAKELTSPHEHSLYFTPSYSLFPKIIKACQLIEHKISLTLMQECSIDLIEKEDEIHSFFLCNPHNPIGLLWREKEMQKIINVCVERNALLFSDDIHSDLVIDSNANYTPASLIDHRINDNVIYFMSPGKTFNISGLQTSYLIIPNDDIRIKATKAINLYGQGTPNTFGLHALEMAYNKCDSWLDEVISYLKANFFFLKKELLFCEPEIKVYPSEATYFAWLDFTGFSSDNLALANTLLKDYNIILEDGINFGEDGVNFFRVNYACPQSYIKVLIEALVDMVDKKRKQNIMVVT
ncbi:MalY/PatB family protein [Serratia oryzae]|uniref:cysteine-S-conjugate beta-lyase n=1 Tax=Serratia oryzae TaxID=2034155 RepID=A0A1S8CGE0_9GAMM|nr:aminotransferase class I/II-fold pyridoxal phosphate-dependent enzyme [Serratia oryzae]OMQ20869.1 hypothetical protein BMI79_17305 [Serratia oryzae]